MDIARYVAMVVLGIVKQLALGANRPDLVEECCECEREVESHDELKKAAGEGNG